jgi:hydrogenase expression/formation protein HypE
MANAESRPSGDRILLGHGSGGRLSHRLIKQLFLPVLGGEHLAPLNDSALLAIGSERLAFTTDSFVVSPVEFPGGDLGRLAVCGTVNDLAVMGARPLYLSAAFLIEEGLERELLERLVRSMHAAAEEAGVEIVTGDTKVVERGGLDRVFVNTAGIGRIDGAACEGVAGVRPGDRVLLNGTLGDHGMAVMACRNDLRFESTIESDCAPLWGLVSSLFEGGVVPRWMRDPTRGGLGTTLNELVEDAPFGVRLEEDAIPIRREVRALSDILGLDPLYVANEGKLIAIIPPDQEGPALEIMRAHPRGRDAAAIGEVVADPAGRVVLATRIGGTRIVAAVWIAASEIPRHSAANIRERAKARRRRRGPFRRRPAVTGD